MIGTPGPMELAIIGIIAILLFGSRLPKIARSMGSSIVEFKKGIKGIEDEVDNATNEVNSAVDMAKQPLKSEETKPV